MTIEKIKILVAVFELPDKKHCQSSPLSPFSRWIGWIGRNWQYCLAGSSKTAPRILIFSIVMGADYSFELISIETYAPQFIRDNKIFLGSVDSILIDPTFISLNYMSIVFFIYFYYNCGHSILTRCTHATGGYTCIAVWNSSKVMWENGHVFSNCC